MVEKLNLQLPKGTKVTKKLAVDAPLRTFTMVEGLLSDVDCIAACEELAVTFQAIADNRRKELDS